MISKIIFVIVALSMTPKSDLSSVPRIDNAKLFDQRFIDIPEDATLLVPQLIRKYGYPCEVHTVNTSDGYILTLHRIPYGISGSSNVFRPPVLLQHGILLSSADWLLAGPQKALGYILADAGYDVWLANSRGNRYSRRQPSQSSFWDFSWHEMGIYDSPATIDYILNVTSQPSLYHIGHSQGTTVFYVMCSEKPEYNSKIKLHMSLAPTAYMDHITSPILQFLSPLDFGLAAKTQLLGYFEILPTFIAEIGQILCQDQIVAQIICSNVLFTFFGFNEKQMNATLLPVILGHSPTGASIKQILHYSQLIKSGRFRQWDAGLIGNLRLYSSFSPPNYLVERITAPIYLFWSRNDWMSHEIDVNRLQVRLKNVKGKILIADPQFNHLDYLYAIQAPQLVYSWLINAMRAFP